ncbi:peptidoglycan-binding protein [Streptomyces sp. V4-01]|uniref:Peptidoglycan-binding protein n=1 Tax=Actinacidiphila polyblastidii TaxID=3110430 RepID=A0ABU7PA25_9ACTN|nr:peptidoglycan-binding protein [Streptomyces sp. V4-01]
MSTPVFEEVEPPPSCVCESCARQRLADTVTRGSRGPTAHRAARALVLAATAAAGTALCGAPALAAPPAPVGVPAAPPAERPAEVTPAPPTPDPAAPPTPTAPADPAAPDGAPPAAPGAQPASDAGDAAAGTPQEPQTSQQAATPQGASDELPDAPLRLTRGQILARAETWVAQQVPYSMTSRWKDGYRQDCSGFVSMAWGLDANAWTGDLHDYAFRITRAQLRPGDILLFHNRADPRRGSHVVVFGGWVDAAHTRYTGYEQTRPGTRVRTTPYAYWTNSARYLPYRYKHLAAGGGSGAPERKAFPGTGVFGPGADNSYVARLGVLLVGRGAGAYYKVGPGSAWGAADRGATRAFQRAQGWTGAAADGLPGPTTWKYLVGHRGKDVRAASRAAVPAAPAVPQAAAAPEAEAVTAASAAPRYPGAAAFRPGRSSDAVLALGRRLAARGFGGHYTAGPSRTWSEADRRNVEAFQRAQGWSGRTADGHPGPETWRRLFS